MGVYVDILANVQRKEDSEIIVVNLSGLSYSKWEHPLESLFDESSEKYLFLNSFFKSELNGEDMDYLRKEEQDDEMDSCTKTLDPGILHTIMSKISDTKLAEILNDFDEEDEEGKIQFLTSFAQLKLLAEIENGRAQRITSNYMDAHVSFW